MSRRTMLLTVAFVAVAVYANSLWNVFAYDDVFIIARNDRVHHLFALHNILLTPYWPSFGSELGLYRPLTILSFALQWAVSGGAPWFFHLINVLLHAVVCLLVFRLTERLVNARAAFAAALLFAVHPLHTEAVANVVGQAELWTAIWVLLACIVYAGRPAGARIPARTRAAVIVLYATGLLFKESAVVLPGLLVLLDFAQCRVAPNRESLKRYLHEVAFVLAMLTVVLLAYLTIRLSVLGNIAGTNAAPGLPYLREHYRVLNALRAWPEFMRLLFVPFDLSVDYGPGLIFPVVSLTPMVALGFVLFGATVVLAFSTPWRARAGLPSGWFLLTILPVSNLLFPIGVLIAERTLYLPSVAVCFLAGFAFDAALASSARESRRLAAFLALVITIVFGARTIVRNPDWYSLNTVWESIRRDHPESYKAQWLNGTRAWAHGRTQIAEGYFLLADRIWPRDSQLMNDIANFYIGQRRFDRAIKYLEESRATTPFVPRTYELLGYAYLYAGQPRVAIRIAEQANAMGGAHHSLTYSTIAAASDALGNYDVAAGAWRAAVRSKYGDLWLNYAMLARSLARGGHTADALAVADTAARKAKGQPAGPETIVAVKQAITDGCYQKGGSAGCDPLVGWLIMAGPPTPLGSGK